MCSFSYWVRFNIVTKEPSQYQLSTPTIRPRQKVIAEKKKKQTKQNKTKNRKKDELKLPVFLILLEYRSVVT